MPLSSLRRLAPVGALILLATVASGPPAAAQTAGVTIVNFAFQPAVLSVAPGTTVTWVNDDNVPHTSTSDSGAWSSPPLAPGASFQFTFTAPGTYTYHCAIHPFMSGEVVVQGAASPTATVAPTSTSIPTATVAQTSTSIPGAPTGTPAPPPAIPAATALPHPTPAGSPVLGKPGTSTGPARSPGPTPTSQPTRVVSRTFPAPTPAPNLLPTVSTVMPAPVATQAPGTQVPIPLAASLPAPPRPAPFIHRI